MPQWLHLLSWAALLLGFGSAAVVVADLIRHPQKMWIMNAVWPVTALYGTVFGLWGYFRYGRLASRDAAKSAAEKGDMSPNMTVPFPVAVGTGSTHCGAGCTLGDIAAEWLAFFVPGIAVWLGYESLFAEKMFAIWILDFLFAFMFGIAFQFFTIAPMRGLGLRDGLIAAVKADTLSLTAWQVGMYGCMALAQFYVFRGLIGVSLEVNTPEFWFVMQIAMMAGFCTSYPVNWWLIRSGIKERM